MATVARRLPLVVHLKHVPRRHEELHPTARRSDQRSLASLHRYGPVSSHLPIHHVEP